MPLVILVVALTAAIVVGTVIAARNGTRAERGAPAAQGPDAPPSAWRGPTLGGWGLVGGISAAVGVALTGQATFGWAPAFDPPEWLRIVSFWMLPVGEVVASSLGLLALRRNCGRRPGLAGLVLAVLAVLGSFALMLSVEF